MKYSREDSLLVPRFGPSLGALSLVLWILTGCGGGGGGGSNGVTPAVPSDASTPSVAGVLTAVPGPGAVRVGFARPTNSDSFAVFVGTGASTLFAGAPAAVDPAGSSTTVAGLSNGQSYRVGLATRASALDPWRPTGPVVSVRPAAPIYVDPTASASGADGLTPATAFPDLSLALIVAGGSAGNVWLRGADYGAVPLTVGDGVALYGGFDASFDLAQRDPVLHPSIIRGASGQPMANVLFGGTLAVLDGLVLEGDGLASIGIDSQDTPLELRSVVVRNCVDRGIRVRGNQSGDPVPLTLAGVDSFANGADGLSAIGTFDAHLFASRFQGNTQEGVEFDDLIADSGRAARLVIDGCSFAGNGSEGADIDLGASLAAVPPGGTFEIVATNSAFELNGLAGLLIDIDYEAVPQWSADISITGCLARANRGPGVHLDLDSTQRSFVHRTRFEANDQQGLLVTSESASGVTVVSASTFSGNAGVGLDAALGNVAVLGSHNVFTGNGTAGMRSTSVRSSATSSLAWLQPTLALGTDTFGAATAASGDLVRVPAAVARATGATAGGVVVDQIAAFELGDLVELGADGVARSVIGITGSNIQLDPAPGSFVAPLALSVFVPPGDVDEDHALNPGATIAGLGLDNADPGPLGAPDAAEPGPTVPPGDLWLRPAVVTPAPLAALGTNDLVRVEFDRELLGSSANSASVRVQSGSGTAISAAINVVSGVLELTAPVGGWPAEVRVELDRGLTALDGAELAAPLVVVWR